MKRVVLITGHYLESRRRAGFHWLANAFWNAGWDVTFLTSAISRLSRLKGDFRFEYPVVAEANRLKRVKDRLTSFVWYTPWHPANLRAGWANRLSAPLFRKYGELPLGPVEERIRQADLVIFESNPALVIFDRVRKLNPKARLVYRVSDDIRLLRNHPVVIEAETHAAPLFDLVSVPSEFLLRRFEGVPKARLQFHALDKNAFAGEFPDPYAGERDPNARHAVFVGQDHVDTQFLDLASQALPDWTFHVIGPIGGLPSRSNVRAYGELPFAETVKYLKHADVGLLNLAFRPGAESFTDSLKMVQYTWCRLPVVAPEFLRTSKPHVFYYEPGNAESIRSALLQAVASDRQKVPVESVRDWEDLRATLAGEKGP